MVAGRSSTVVPSIAEMTKSDNGSLVGTVRTLTVNAKTRFAPATEKTKDNAPDFRVFAGPAEIGAAWKKTANGSGGQMVGSGVAEAATREAICMVAETPSARCNA